MNAAIPRVDWDESLGFAITPFVDADELPPLIDECERLLVEEGVHRAGVRHVTEKSPVLAALATSPALLALIEPILPGKPTLVRSIIFDKTAEANWHVRWHQDKTIAVAARAEVPGYGPWSEKDGVPHVRPPAAIMERMLNVRLHLDATDDASGALRLAPGTHRSGYQSVEEIVEGFPKPEAGIKDRHESSKIAIPDSGFGTAISFSTDAKVPGPPDRPQLERIAHTCAASAGDLLLMRPLLFHSSRQAIHPHRRRVLHLEYAAVELPEPLRWA